MSPDEMAEVIDADDRYLALSAAAIQAALATLNDQRVAALAQALGDGLRDEAQLDTSWLVVQALADLESPHVRVLHLMATEQCPPAQRGDQELGPGVWREKALRERLPGLRDGLLPIMATLDRQALVFGGGLAAAVDDRVWSLTDFGRKCLRYLTSAQNQAAPPAGADGAAG